jgi:hypothetical protein
VTTRVRRSFFRWLAVLAALLLLVTACRPSGTSTPPQIRLVPSGGGIAAHVEVAPISRADRQAIERAVKSQDDWHRLLRVSVKPAQDSNARVAIAGTYAARDNTVTFTPLFPFDPGRDYEVALDLSAAKGGSAAAPITTIVALPAPPPSPPTVVARVYPSGDTIPENQLRFYIEFSAPRGRGSGLDHIRLLDDRDREVKDPFLPVDADLWNTDRTRYTVFFDPGRQKRGILPNREMGRSLVAGRRYTLVVDREWIDGNSRPLRETFKRTFLVVPADLAPIDYAKWHVTSPAAGTREPLEVMFPEPLDHGLLFRAIGVKRDGQTIVGDVQVDEHERRWKMTPSTAWIAGRHELIALSILEDLAGNRIGRAFEIVSAARGDSPAETDRQVASIPFVVSATAR